MEHAVVTQGLSKCYGTVHAVRNLSLKVPIGSVFGFLGPNGAGKTTTIRMLLGLVRQTSGEARVLGADTWRERRQVAARVGAIVEVPAFYPYLNGEENLRVLALGAGLETSGAELTQLLERVGLQLDAKRLVKGYSLGMKQRLGIAAALMGNPPVLFLDEPTNGLDPDGAREVRALLGSLRSSGRTIFVSSHLLVEVERFCTDVAIVHAGELRVQGRVSDLLKHSGFEVRVSSVTRACEVLRQLPGVTAGSGPGWMTLDHEEPAIPAMLRTLQQAGVDVFEVRPRRSTLEQLFFEATGRTSSEVQGP